MIQPNPNLKDEEMKDLYNIHENMSLIKNLEINEQTWKSVCNLSMIAPILKLHAIEGALQSPID